MSLTELNYGLYPVPNEHCQLRRLRQKYDDNRSDYPHVPGSTWRIVRFKASGQPVTKREARLPLVIANSYWDICLLANGLEKRFMTTWLES